MEIQCASAVGDGRLKKRRRTGGGDCTFDEARAREVKITFEEDDFPNDVSDEPQDLLCTLRGSEVGTYCFTLIIP